MAVKARAPLLVAPMQTASALCSLSTVMNSVPTRPSATKSATGTAISVSDFDAGSGTMQVTLDATNGTLNLAGTHGLSFSVGDGTADATMTFTGTIADINTALEGMTFVATAAETGAEATMIYVPAAFAADAVLDLTGGTDGVGAGSTRYIEDGTFTDSGPVPDIVALSATLTGDGIVNLANTGVFAVATVNLGAAGTITVSADTGDTGLPVSIALCEMNPATGVCINPTVPTLGPVITSIASDATPRFAFLVTETASVPFDPANKRVFVRFKDAGGVTRGSTSVAVRSVP